MKHTLVLTELWDQLTGPECFEAELIRIIEAQDDIEADQFAIRFDRADAETLPDIYSALVERGFRAQGGDDVERSKKSVDRRDIIKEINFLDDLLCGANQGLI